MARPVFLSVGRSLSKPESDFITELCAQLEARGLQLRRARNLMEFPIVEIAEILTECDGLIAITFERTRAGDVVEFPKADSGGKRLGELHYTTGWNHIESAIARALGKPVLIFAQHGCHAEGMMDHAYVYWLHFQREELASPNFTLAVDDWINRLDKARAEGDKKRLMNPDWQ